jgi:pyruvate/2-oxoglutarate dehydrogenase complex dihydrolipoamide acyltransferase (E2) component
MMGGTEPEPLSAKSQLLKRLSEVQVALKAPKSNYNSFGKYSYRSAEDILEAAKPLCMEHGLTLTLTDEPVVIGDWHYIRATATVEDGDAEKSVTAYAREDASLKGMHDSQTTGATSSFARKYALNGLFCIDDSKADPDSMEQQPQATQPAARPQVAQPVREPGAPTKASTDPLSAVWMRLGAYQQARGGITAQQAASELAAYVGLSDIQQAGSAEAGRIIQGMNQVINQAQPQQAASQRF